MTPAEIRIALLNLTKRMCPQDDEKRFEAFYALTPIAIEFADGYEKPTTRERKGKKRQAKSNNARTSGQDDRQDTAREDTHEYPFTDDQDDRRDEPSRLS